MKTSGASQWLARRRFRVDWFFVGVMGLGLLTGVGIWQHSGLDPARTANPIIFNVSISYVASVILWLLVAWLPERRRRGILRTNLRNHYMLFREEIAHILLRAAARGSHAIDIELPKKLVDPAAFREYFSVNRDQNWYDALNGLQSNAEVLQDLLLEIDLFANEVASVVAKVEFDDSEPLAFFKRLIHHVQRLKNASVYSYDQVKYLGNFVWEVMAL
jgi:hypothetical protein